MDHSFSETCASQTQNIALYNKYKDSNMSIIAMHQDGYQSFQSFVIQLYKDSTKQQLIQILKKVKLEKIELGVKYDECMTQLVQVKREHQTKIQDLQAKNQDLEARVIKLERLCQNLVRQNQDLLSRLPTTKKKQKLDVTLAENKKFK